MLDSPAVDLQKSGSGAEVQEEDLNVGAGSAEVNVSKDTSCKSGILLDRSFHKHCGSNLFKDPHKQSVHEHFVILALGTSDGTKADSEPGNELLCKRKVHWLPSIHRSLDHDTVVQDPEESCISWWKTLSTLV